MSLGNTLRAAREACGMTTSELAARTHMLVQIVEGLENGDFRRIPAPIYGRGFIKLYCEAVNIDPKPLQAEFMELFNRQNDPAANAEQSPKRPPSTPMPALEPAPAMPIPEPPPMQASEPPQAQVEMPAEPAMADLGELFAQPAQPADQPPKLTPIWRPEEQPTPMTRQSPQPPKRSYGDIFGQAYATEEETPKMSAAEKFRTTMSNVSSGVFSNVQKLPPNIGRIVTVSLCAALTVALIGWGIFELYKATSPADGALDENSESIAEKAPEAKSAEKSIENKSRTNAAKNTASKATKTMAENPASRTVRSVSPSDLKSSGIEIPALYID